MKVGEHRPLLHQTVKDECAHFPSEPIQAPAGIRGIFRCDVERIGGLEFTGSKKIQLGVERSLLASVCLSND